MKQSVTYGFAGVLALVAGGIFYSTIGLSGWLITTIQMVVALSAGVLTFILWGMAERTVKSSATGEAHQMSIRLLLTPVYGALVVPRLGLAVLVGLLTNALMHNARYSTLYVGVMSALFTVGFAVALVAMVHRRFSQAVH